MDQSRTASNNAPDATPRASSSAFDLDLVRKYSHVAAPRYTSYPPATKFSDELAVLRAEDAIAGDNNPAADDNDGQPLSLYFHLPFCESRCWYCGCTAVITRDQGAADAYLDDLAREMELVTSKIDRRRKVAQLHLGGGSPTFFTPGQLRRLNGLVRAHFAYAPDAEVSVEIDPRKFSQEHVHALREMGATRASLGIQDTNRRVQLAIHRYQPNTLNQQAVAWLREQGFTSINLDLIYGLPLQTAASFERTLADVLALSPDRLSIFSYAHIPWIKPAQRIFEDRGQLPGAEEKLAMFALAHKRLTDAGFVDIGLDHFAKPDDELAAALRNGTLQRNFQGYSTKAGTSLYAFGMSAISQTRAAYWQNTKDLAAYRATLAGGRLPVARALCLSAEDQRRRTIIMRIMCDRQIDFAAISAELGVDFAQTHARELASMSDLVADGIVRLTSDKLEITPVGVPLLRLAAMRFDTTLARPSGPDGSAPPMHARVI
ncbi:oxygen-independent coproporphyrinogen-3 oxidase [Ereboglobus sp. PH5-5]|uniref:oxygen-independent coproporphyrinogen III oxidase n=1 Tax=Ereboglobus sp. PH5-5 TaxID=2940529 RepID=UPI002405A950|nr:oxygen-independent coproporphyrinogen III oxidase [Ereboglobus sp. PH5-5]MDF9833119.1 oxygen-independent coproporphyrinogen-3 oxidase [Ereboglobus sp. PH5-5]